MRSPYLLKPAAACIFGSAHDYHAEGYSSLPISLPPASGESAAGIFSSCWRSVSLAQINLRLIGTD